MVSIERKKLDLALTALCLIRMQLKEWEGGDQSIADLKEALAQDELCSSQEPVRVLTDAGQDANMSWPLMPKGKGKMLLNNRPLVELTDAEIIE